MTSYRPFHPLDLLKFNKVNMDDLTETYGFHFYLNYMVNWPELNHVAEHPNGEIMGYIMGKAEGKEEEWHGHVTALSVAPEFRKLGVAHQLMETLEAVSDRKDCYFVDLFVRDSNKVAKDFYKSMKYFNFRKIEEYYESPRKGERGEDAWDMHKPLTKGKQLKAEDELVQLKREEAILEAMDNIKEPLDQQPPDDPEPPKKNKSKKKKKQV